MKKIIAFVFICMFAFSLFSCGRTNTFDTAEFTVPEGGYDGSEVTIKFYHTMGKTLREVLEKYIVEFNKLYPNITVQHEQVGGYDDVRDQNVTKIIAGQQPNITYCYADHVALFRKSNSVVQLDNLINSKETVTDAKGNESILGYTDAQKADFIEGYYNEGKAFGDGHMYMLPFSKSTEVLYYNKTFFTQNNIQVPTTWDEMETVIRRIKEIDNNPLCIPLGYDSEANWFITMTEQQGTPYTSATGDHYIYDTPENRAFTKRFRSWYQNSLMTTQQLYGGYTSGMFKNTTDDQSNHSYMSIGSSAGATNQRPDKAANGRYPFEVGIAPIPQVNANSPKVISQGPSVCIFNKTNPQEVIASWLFVKFLTTSISFQAQFSMVSGYVPVIKSVMENEIYKEFLESADGYESVAALSVKQCLAQADAYYTSPAFTGSSRARDQVGNLMQSIFAYSMKTNPNGYANEDAMIAALFADSIQYLIDQD